ncbi:calcium-binding protein, partial [Acinetobacter sp. 3657]|uniref:calcium-binding protein n=1 Tax=Acinetobacter sp. 3657 TaxID=2817764 RepID=UPI0028636EAE|nr:Ca2+-binding RTX toxin-like protein [Prolinoborus sp. 3657]
TGKANINATGNTKDNILIGNSGNNILDGGAGNDTLDGGLGADTMIGGLGNDIYYVDNILDNVVEKESEGYDIIYSSVNYTLKGRHVEELQLTGKANINATGNTKDNILIGNSGNNILDGGAGNDILIGGAGNDTLIGGLGSDTVIFNLLTAADEAGGNGMDTWLDFKLGNTLTDPNADRVNISELLIDFDGDKTVESLMSFISFTKQGKDSVMNIDRDGFGQDFNSTALLTFKNIDVTLMDLFNNHQIIV